MMMEVNRIETRSSTRVKPPFAFILFVLTSLTTLTACGKTLRSPFDELRANGGALEITRDFPFMLRLSKHENDFSAACYCLSAEEIIRT
jgi:hypothetical protein